MNLNGLVETYSLTPLKLSPADLLLDPTNPRLITESSQVRRYTPEAIVEPDVQAKVLELVCQKEHGVKQLITSITEMGFIGGLHEMIVKDLGKGRGYLVIEGNRRTAALKHLLSHAGKLRADVRKSIQEIEVKKFVYHRNERHDESKVIDVLLGSIHIDGPKEWGALEKAHYVHRSYLRELGKGPFRYEVDVSRRVGLAFKMSPKLVHKYLTICRVYEQLKASELAVEPRHYTLIDLATKTRCLAEPYFGLDAVSCELSDVGVERFDELFLGENPPIHNPKLFQSFVGIYTDGTELELGQVIEGERSADDIYAAIRVRKSRREFREDLTQIRQRIRDLRIADFKGTEGEKAEIRKIGELVDEILMPLTKGR